MIGGSHLFIYLSNLSCIAPEPHLNHALQVILPHAAPCLKKISATTILAFYDQWVGENDGDFAV